MRITYLIVFIVFVILSSCQFEQGDINYNLGNDFIDDPTNVIMIDTLTVRSYTSAMDSFTTSQGNRLLTGRTVNQIGIETYAESYFRFDSPGRINFHASSVYDSICMFLKLDGYKFGDTTEVETFEIYRLTDDIVFESTTQRIYNTTRFESESEPIASFSVDFGQDNRMISFRLPDELGKQLFDMSFNQSDTIRNNELFKEFFKGLVIKPVKENTSFIMGIEAIADSTSSPRMRIYFNDINVVDNLYFDFPLERYEYYPGSFTPEYTNYLTSSYVMNDYTGTVLEGIDQGDIRFSSTETNNITLLQGGNMMNTQIEIPHIGNLYQFGVGSIVKAVLYIDPLDDSFETASNLPPVLQMNLIDSKGRLYKPLYVTGTEDLAFGTLRYDREFKENTHYAYDITNYLKTEYEEVANQEYSLFLMIPYSQNNLNVNQLIIGDSKNRNDRMKLKLYLTNF